MTLRYKVMYKERLVSGVVRASPEMPPKRTGFHDHAVKRNANVRFPWHTEKAGSVFLAAKLITEVLQQRMAILQFREMVAKYVFMR